MLGFLSRSQMLVGVGPWTTLRVSSLYIFHCQLPPSISASASVLQIKAECCWCLMVLGSGEPGTAVPRESGHWGTRVPFLRGPGLWEAEKGAETEHMLSTGVTNCPSLRGTEGLPRVFRAKPGKAPDTQNRSVSHLNKIRSCQTLAHNTITWRTYYSGRSGHHSQVADATGGA